MPLRVSPRLTTCTRPLVDTDPLAAADVPR
nr:MAG TPA: hypothetical protein [Caudoviricetes sp.]